MLASVRASAAVEPMEQGHNLLADGNPHDQHRRLRIQRFRPETRPAHRLLPDGVERDVVAAERGVPHHHPWPGPLVARHGLRRDRTGPTPSSHPGPRHDYLPRRVRRRFLELVACTQIAPVQDLSVDLSF